MIGLGDVPYHTHTGVGSDGPKVDYRDLANLPATDFVPSFLSPHREGDSTTVISTDDFDYLPSFTNGLTSIEAVGGAKHYQIRNTASDWAAVNQPWGVIKNGQYVYALLEDTDTAPDTYRIYRYDKDDLSAGGTEMTFSGTAPDLTTDSTLKFACDGTNFYINYDGGNSANAYVLAKYTVSGTVFTYVESITCGSATLGFNTSFQVLSDGSIYTIDQSTDSISKFTPTGTLVYTDQASSLSVQFEMIQNFENILYSYDTTRKSFIKLYYT